MALLVLAEVACHASRCILDHRSRERFTDGYRAREWHVAVTRNHACAGEATTAPTSSSPRGAGDVNCGYEPTREAAMAAFANRSYPGSTPASAVLQA